MSDNESGEIPASDDRGNTNREPRGMDEAAVIFFCGCGAFQDKNQGAANCRDVDGLVGRVQYENRFLQRPLVVILRHNIHPAEALLLAAPCSLCSVMPEFVNRKQWLVVSG